MSENAEKVIVVDKLVKNFEVNVRKPGLFGGLSSLISPQKKTIRALKGISFTINKGELVGFIGPNGAGKTTTLKVLSGLLYPSAGFTSVLGYDPWNRRQSYLKQISLVMGQKNQLWWDLPATETFLLNKAIYEIPEKTYKQTLNELTEMLEVEELVGIQVRRLSLGQRMRMELIAALLHQPKVLFLDEPTIGLDVVGQQTLREFVQDYNRKFQATILLTSHNMDDVQDLAKRVIVIDKGELLFDGKLKDLISDYAREKTIRLSLARDVGVEMLNKVGKIKKQEFPEITLSVPRKTAAFAAAEILQALPVNDLTIEEEPIESIIRRVFKGEITKDLKHPKNH